MSQKRHKQDAIKSHSIISMESDHLPMCPAQHMQFVNLQNSHFFNVQYALVGSDEGKNTVERLKREKEETNKSDSQQDLHSADADAVQLDRALEGSKSDEKDKKVSQTRTKLRNDGKFPCFPINEFRGLIRKG